MDIFFDDMYLKNADSSTVKKYVDCIHITKLINKKSFSLVNMYVLNVI